VKPQAKPQWLWAPWRKPYLEKATRTEAPPSCFFCDYVRHKKRDRRNLVLTRRKTCFSVMNRYPYTSGHLLVAPLAHKPDLADLTPKEREELFDLVLSMQAALGRTLHPHGYNIGINLGRAAGAGVPGHAHFHVVPRWVGDTNFMSTAGQTKVISESLEALYDHLQKALGNGR